MLTPRQNEILDAALILISEDGIQRLTMKRLSASLGITEPAIYRHFTSKAEILQQMIQRFDVEIPAEESLHGLAGIEAFLRARAAQVMAQPALARVLFAEELFLNDPACSELLLNLMHRHRAALCRFFEEAQADGEIRSGIDRKTLFRLVLGPFRLLIRQWGLSGQAFLLEEELNALLTALHESLKPNGSC